MPGFQSPSTAVSISVQAAVAEADRGRRTEQRARDRSALALAAHQAAAGVMQAHRRIEEAHAAALAEWQVHDPPFYRYIPMMPYNQGVLKTTLSLVSTLV